MEVVSGVCTVVMPFRSVLSTAIMVALLFARGILTFTAVHQYTLSVEKLEDQLQKFQFANAQCSFEDDRNILQQCVQHWFGSVEDRASFKDLTRAYPKR